MQIGIGILNDTLQQRLVMDQDAVDRRRIEQISIVVTFENEAPVDKIRGQCQVHAGKVDMPLVPRDLQASL